MGTNNECRQGWLSPGDIPVPFAELDPGGRVLSCNLALLELAGYAGESPGKMPPQIGLIPPEWRPGSTGEKGEPGPRHFSAELTARDGAIIRVEAFVHRIDDVHGRPCMFLVNVLDAATIRSMAETELVQAEKRASVVTSLLEEVKSPIFATDERSRIVYANATAGRLFGMPADATIGKDLWYMYQIPPTELFFRIYQRAMHEGRPLSVDHYSQRLNAWYEALLYPREEGGMVIVMHNVTARKQYERFLGLAAYTVNQLSDFVFWLDARGRISKANDTAYKRLSFPENPKALTHISAVSDISEDAWGKIWEEIKSKGLITLKARLYRRDGDTIPVDMSISYIYYIRKEYGIIIARDISDRIKAEQEITRAREQAELYLDLMSHDINNMNQVGQGYLELAMSDPGLSNEEKELLEKPLEAFQRSSELIANVKKLQKAGMAGPFERTDLATMLRDVAFHYSSAMGRDVHIELCAGEACHVMANPLLKEVFANLVSNAIKHSGGKINIWIRLGEVILANKPCCEVVVEDNGPGIPDEVKATLFSPKMPHEKGPRSRGLGLIIVKSLLDDFRGTIAVEDRVPGDYHQGTRFIVTLPVA